MHVTRYKKAASPVHQVKGISFEPFQQYDSKLHSNLHKCSQCVHIWVHFKHVHINISMLQFILHCSEINKTALRVLLDGVAATAATATASTFPIVLALCSNQKRLILLK